MNVNHLYTSKKSFEVIESRVSGIIDEACGDSDIAKLYHTVTGVHLSKYYHNQMIPLFVMNAVIFLLIAAIPFSKSKEKLHNQSIEPIVKTPVD